MSVSVVEALDTTELTIIPLLPTIGAEIHGFDLSQPLPPSVAAEIRAAVIRHKVVFFRDHHLDLGRPLLVRPTLSRSRRIRVHTGHDILQRSKSIGDPRRHRRRHAQRLEHRWARFRNIAGERESYRDGDYVIPNDGTAFGRLYGGRSPSPGLVSFTGTSPADAAVLTATSRRSASAAASITSVWA